MKKNIGLVMIIFILLIYTVYKVISQGNYLNITKHSLNYVVIISSLIYLISIIKRNNV
ncbi:hypothetical protein SAMN04489761_3247 [Tenacibaculum sp. MAR_2009_124]|nr:hypothetical protein SAMN04489761_3247 [Tenacibaculum sp. MAR_2009_124]